MTLTDDDGGSDTVEILINVENDAPEFGTVNSVAGDEGDSVAVSAAFTDNDASGNYTSVIDWGDATTSTGSVIYDNGNGTVTGEHIYADNDTYVVTITVTDEAGNSGNSTTDAFISNVSPAVDSVATQTVDVAQTLTLPQVQFTDPGFTVAGNSQESFSVTIDWGDGNTTTETAVVTQGSEGVATVGLVDASHLYSDPGTFPASITVTDDDNGSSTQSFTVNVNNVAPVISAIAPIAADEGDSVSVNADFTDTRSGETYEATIDWGDVVTDSICGGR